MALQKTVNDLIRTNVFLSVTDKKALKGLARRRGVSYSTLIRELVATLVGSKSAPFEFKQVK